MRIIGLFAFLVLPLFLWVCIKIINQSDFGKKPGGAILKGIFYFFIGLSLLGVVLMLAQIF